MTDWSKLSEVEVTLSEVQELAKRELLVAKRDAKLGGIASARSIRQRDELADRVMWLGGLVDRVRLIKFFGGTLSDDP